MSDIDQLIRNVWKSGFDAESINDIDFCEHCLQLKMAFDLYQSQLEQANRAIRMVNLTYYKPLRTILPKTTIDALNELEQDREKNKIDSEFLKAVSHIGVDFGYGKYQLEEKWIKYARERLTPPPNTGGKDGRDNDNT